MHEIRIHFNRYVGADSTHLDYLTFLIKCSGDYVAQSAGTSDDPEITSHTLIPQKDIFIIFASDGIWVQQICIWLRRAILSS